MSMFSIYGIAGSGVVMHRNWLDAVANNVANANTVRSTATTAFVPQRLTAQSMGSTPGEVGQGVTFNVVQYGDPAGRLVHDPEHPLADAEGYVRHADVDMVSEMSHLLMAQRGYQANLSVVQRATEAYQAALQLGRA